MEQNNYSANWITSVYTLMRNREYLLLESMNQLETNVSFHNGVKHVYDEGLIEGEYPHLKTLEELQEAARKAKEEYWKAKSQTDQMVYFMLSLLLLKK